MIGGDIMERRIFCPLDCHFSSLGRENKDMGVIEVVLFKNTNKSWFRPSCRYQTLFAVV